MGTQENHNKENTSREGLSLGWRSWRSRNAVFSLLSINAILSFCCFNAVLGVASTNSMISIGSIHCLFCVLSIHSINSILSVYSRDSVLAIGCTGKMLQICFREDNQCVSDSPATLNSEVTSVRPFLGPFHHVSR